MSYTLEEMNEFIREINEKLCCIIIMATKEVKVMLDDKRRVMWCRGARSLLYHEYSRHLIYIHDENGQFVKIILDPPKQAFRNYRYCADRKFMSKHDSLIADIGDFAITKIKTMLDTAIAKDKQSLRISTTSIKIDKSIIPWNRQIKDSLKFVQRKNGYLLSIRENPSNCNELEIFIFIKEKKKEVVIMSNNNEEEEEEVTQTQPTTPQTPQQTPKVVVPITQPTKLPLRRLQSLILKSYNASLSNPCVENFIETLVQ